MMKSLKDFSEVLEASALFEKLIDQSAVVGPANQALPVLPPIALKRPLPYAAEAVQPAAATAPAPATAPAALSPRLKAPTPRPELPELDDMVNDSQYRGDRLKKALHAMCKRGGFSGAVVADTDGLPLAVYNSPVGDDVLAAFTIVLGEALDKAGKMLGQNEANNISLDINYMDKAILRQFSINDVSFYMMVICPQETDERSEVELSIDQVMLILNKQ